MFKKSGLLFNFFRKIPTTRFLSTKVQFRQSPQAAISVTDFKQSRESLDVQFTSEQDELKTYSYPFVWLRDNCQCSECYSKAAEARLFMLKNLDLNIKPKHVDEGETNTIKVTWPDNHTSEYDLDWLKSRRFTDTNMQYRHAVHMKPVKHWGKEMQNNIPKFKFSELIQCDKTLYKWLVNIEEIGICLITDAPTEVGVLHQIGERVAFLRTINYGETFTVKSKFNPSNAAYTGANLGFHTDLAYYHYTPGVQFLHCISQVESEGGDNVFADGFHVATLIKNEHPTLYNILKDTLIDFYDIGTDHYKFHKLTRIPVIQEDEKGQVCKITYGNHSRDSHFSVPLEKVPLLYKAMFTLEETMNGERCCIKHKLQNGEIACFHNYRVLHGRDSFNVTTGGERHLEGGYIDWDEMRSKRRVLEAELGIIEN